MSSHSLSYLLNCFKFHLNTSETTFPQSQFLFVCISVVHVPPALSSTQVEQSCIEHEQWVI